eukprot:1263201-Pleurochrysis_carterae.AAC.1
MSLDFSLSEAEYNRLLVSSTFNLYNVYEDGDSHIIMGGKKRTISEANSGAEGSLKVELSQTTGGYLLQISGHYQMRTASETYMYLCSDDVSYNMEVSSTNNRLTHSNVIAKIPVDSEICSFDAFHKTEYSVPYHLARDSVMQSLHLQLVTSR